MSASTGSTSYLSLSCSKTSRNVDALSSHMSHTDIFVLPIVVDTTGPG
jgi:hypothetical protein